MRISCHVVAELLSRMSEVDCQMCHAVKCTLITVSGALHCCMYIPSKVHQIAGICWILHNLALRTDLCNSGAQSDGASDLCNL